MSESSGREERIFAEALVLPEGERQRFIVEACQGDGDLRKRVEALVRAHESAEGFMDAPPATEPEDPVRRRVALKIIKLGMDTKEVIARFEAERQALAMMDHPNIAKILDAG